MIKHIEGNWCNPNDLRLDKTFLDMTQKAQVL